MTREECAEAHYQKFEKAVGLPTAEAQTLFKALMELAWQEGYTVGVRDTGNAVTNAIGTAGPTGLPVNFEPAVIR